MLLKRPLNSSGSKSYDANTDALANAITLSNLAGGETLVRSGTASTSSANAGSYTINNLAGISISMERAMSNYTLTGGTHSFTINRRVVSLSGGSRQYNGSATAIAADLPTINNLVGSETLTLSGNGVVENANVGDNKPLTNLSGLTLQNGSNGGLAANYTLSGGSSIISITPRILSLDGSRVYDGTTNSNSSDLTISNLVGSETVSLSGFGTVTSGNVGTNKTITLNTLSLSDGSGSASNYTLTGGTILTTLPQERFTYSGTKSL